MMNYSVKVKILLLSVTFIPQFEIMGKLAEGYRRTSWKTVTKFLNNFKKF